MEERFRQERKIIITWGVIFSIIGLGLLALGLFMFLGDRVTVGYNYRYQLLVSNGTIQIVLGLVFTVAGFIRIFNTTKLAKKVLADKLEQQQQDAAQEKSLHNMLKRVARLEEDQAKRRKKRKKK